MSQLNTSNRQTNQPGYSPNSTNPMKTESNKPNPMNSTNNNARTQPAATNHPQPKTNIQAMNPPKPPTTADTAVMSNITKRNLARRQAISDRARKQATTINRTRTQPAATKSTAMSTTPPLPAGIPRDRITNYRCDSGSKVSFIHHADGNRIEGPFVSKGPTQPFPSFAEQLDALLKTTRNTAHEQDCRIELEMKLPSGRVFKITAEPGESKQTAEVVQ